MRRIVLLAILVLARTAHADFESDMVDHWIDNYERNMVEDNVLRGSPQRGGTSASPTTVVPKRAPRVPAQLAAKAAPEQRAALERQYTQLLSTYATLAQKLHIPERDVAGGLAFLVCSAYTAYRGQDLSDSALAAIRKQLQGILLKAPAFTKLGVAQKQDMYEQVAIVATQLAISLYGATSDPAKQAELRDAGKQILAVFGDPDKLAIDEHGVALGR